MLVHYVEPSMDAAIAGNYKDLKFKNNLDAPVYIEGYCSGGIIYLMYMERNETIQPGDFV